MVHIIVLHYKSKKDTKQCLESLKKIDYPDFKVIVVDNDKDNRGFAGGNNYGIKKSNADYILLLNNDTVVHKDFLKEMVKKAEQGYGIVGSKIYYHNSKKIWFEGGKVNWLRTKARHVKGKTDFITGCCMLIKREVIDKIGLMDERYFLFFEDVDYCLRARKKRYMCAIADKAKIYHKVSKQTKEFSFKYIYYHFRNGLLLAKKNAFILVKLIAYFISFLIYFKQLIKSSSKWTKAIKLGIKDFYKGRFGDYENWY